MTRLSCHRFRANQVALDEGEAGQFHDLLARLAGGEAEVALVKSPGSCEEAE
jgi:hypothetical protein